jgi:hypothetical protein
MAESKFSGLRTIRHESPRETEIEPTPTPEAPRERGGGRPTGKRSNPDWKLYSHFLKKRTQREAGDILRAEDKGRDLSDVLQELLEQWIAQQRGG